MNLVILTATYNHPDKLYSLYESLEKQSDKSFKWYVIDDGSNESTKKTVSEILKNSKFDIKYYKKKNSGKSKTINYGLDKILNYDFVLIVDDDEYLYNDAIKIVKRYYNRYINTNVSSIHFNRADYQGNMIANPIIKEDQIMSTQERKKRNYHQDGYIGYFSDKLQNTRAPEFEGEKYVGVSVLTMTLSKNYDTVWAKDIIGKTEYLEGGITDQGRKLRIKNPKGMYVYCLLMQNKDSGLILRLVYSLYGYAYLDYSNLNEYELRNEINNYDEELIPIMKPLSKILSRYWKIKYDN